MACLGVIGDDANGIRLSRMLDAAGIDVQGLIAVPDRPTTSKQRVIGLAQHRHRQQLMRIDEECNLDISSAVQEELLKYVDEFLDEYDVVCLEDYNKGVLCSPFCQAIIERARRQNKPVLVDPAMIKDYSRYNGAYLVKPNRRELGLATGTDVNDNADWTEAAQELVTSLDLDNLVVTLDKQGAYLCQRNGEGPLTAGYVLTRARNVYDVTGAGDMVLAMLALLAGALSRGDIDATVTEMVQLANVAGGLEVERFGAVGITRDEIVAELSREHRAQCGKLLPLDALLEELNWHRQRGLKIVFTNGCFDLLHPGHIGLLTLAKQEGDILVVAINSDASVRANKGPQRPILKQQDRAALLSALEVVDYVVIFDAPDPLELIKAIGPDILVKGTDWAGAVVGQDYVEAHGGKVALVPISKGFSTTNIIEQVITKVGSSSKAVVSDE